MTRPKIPRKLQFNPKIYYFKPQGIPLRLLQENILENDEVEALKLHEVDNLDHTSASKSMGISQPTFTRILDCAYKKIADAIINGKAIRIEKSS